VSALLLGLGLGSSLAVRDLARLREARRTRVKLEFLGDRPGGGELFLVVHPEREAALASLVQGGLDALHEERVAQRVCGHSIVEDAELAHGARV